MGGHSKRSCSVEIRRAEPPTPPPPTPAFYVQCDGIPDVSDYYYEDGVYNGKPLYKKPDSLFYVWWDDNESWIVNATPGVLAGGYYYYINPTVYGRYSSENPYTGGLDVNPL